MTQDSGEPRDDIDVIGGAAPSADVAQDAVELSDRCKSLLQIVVQEYVDTAQPVGSRIIADNYQLGVSSATIRNDLATLEKAGLLTHPHTSAGRVPTDAGYRYFVRHLLSNTELPPAEQRMIRHQFHQARQEVDQWLRLSTAVLARASQAAALATLPRAHETRFKHLELLAIRDSVVLVVLVLQGGAVKQQIITLDAPLEQPDLSRISNELNEKFADATTNVIVSEALTLSTLAHDIAMLVLDLMKREDEHLSEGIYRDGLAQMLEAPEFAEGENMRRIVQVFEQRSFLDEVLTELVSVSHVHVLIAGEGRYVELQDVALVLSRYGVEDEATGMLGVIGPMRMPYARTIGAVRYVSDLMSDLMHQIYGK
ncbi:MAG: heat-inducible transcription repressor HrcA [Caldilineaceae bacterium]|nr:heat-inducible transcription repressor HrcA [Caldilineaceae bacterium]